MRASKRGKAKEKEPKNKDQNSKSKGMEANPKLVGTIPMWGAIILPNFIKIGQRMWAGVL